MDLATAWILKTSGIKRDAKPSQGQGTEADHALLQVDGDSHSKLLSENATFQQQAGSSKSMACKMKEECIENI